MRWLVLLCASPLWAAPADQDAQSVLVQSEQSLEKAPSFKVSWHAHQEYMAAVPQMDVSGSLTLQRGNRCLLTNAGAFFIFNSQMECVSDGTNFLALFAQKELQWEPGSIRADFNKSLVRSFVLGGATEIIVSQVATTLPQEAVDPASKLLPLLTNVFSPNTCRLAGEDTIDGKLSEHIALTMGTGTNAPEKQDLWLDKTTLLPIKRILHDKSSGDIIEDYTFDLNPKVPPDAFSPNRIIQSRGLESEFHKMEMPDSLLLKASQTGNVTLAAESLAKGASPNAKTDITQMPPSFPALAFAAKGGNVDLVKLLVEHGADVNIGASSGATPLQFAAMGGNANVVNYLVAHGAALTNAAGALCWAAWRGYSNIVVFLVEKGVPVDQPSGELGTPLQRAVQGGFVDIAGFLVKHGADINKPERGSSPLHAAVRFGSPEMVRFCLESGANPNARDSYSGTPLMYAASDGHAAAVKLLLEHGADPQLRNSRGLTAMDLVPRSSSGKEITELFDQLGLKKTDQSGPKKP